MVGREVEVPDYEEYSKKSQPSYIHVFDHKEKQTSKKQSDDFDFLS